MIFRERAYPNIAVNRRPATVPTSVIKMEIPYARVMVSDCVTRYSYAPRLHFSGKKEYPF